MGSDYYRGSMNRLRREGERVSTYRRGNRLHSSSLEEVPLRSLWEKVH